MVASSMYQQSTLCYIPYLMRYVANVRLKLSYSDICLYTVFSTMTLRANIPMD